MAKTAKKKKSTKKTTKKTTKEETSNTKIDSFFPIVKVVKSRKISQDESPSHTRDVRVNENACVPVTAPSTSSSGLRVIYDNRQLPPPRLTLHLRDKSESQETNEEKGQDDDSLPFEVYVDSSQQEESPPPFSVYVDNSQQEESPPPFTVYVDNSQQEESPPPFTVYVDNSQQEESPLPFTVYRDETPQPESFTVYRDDSPTGSLTDFNKESPEPFTVYRDEQPVTVHRSPEPVCYTDESPEDSQVSYTETSNYYGSPDPDTPPKPSPDLPTTPYKDTYHTPTSPHHEHADFFDSSDEDPSFVLEEEEFSIQSI
ncbi:hypothetical protein BDB01DRAFT_837705 [Pilobolus umbonatus]|nr:hypothetical protein BDB01DRAFT_837705 [Pilobolus umbonatus]